MNITPKNNTGFPWAGKDLDKFADDFSYKPVELTGYYDHTKEYKVETMYKGEKGVQIITPFYTHLKNGKPNAIFVDRGWVPYDLKDLKHHYCAPGSVQGFLYRGEPDHKYSLPNNPTINDFHTVRLDDFVLVSQIPNADEASQFMLKQVDFDPNKRQTYPHCLTTDDHVSPWKIPKERNLAYESLWRMITYAGVVANTAAWLYF